MSYNGKIYVAYDALNDAKARKALNAFKTSDGKSFNFYDGAEYAKLLDVETDDSLKAKIQKNMDGASIVLVVLSKTLKSMRRFSKWQVEYAICKEMPIIVLNNSRIRAIDNDITPTILKNHLCLYIPNDEKALELACLNWPKSNTLHIQNGDKTPYRYDYDVYKELYNEEDE